jgi:acetyl-CoA C-acetyltransferase
MMPHGPGMMHGFDSMLRDGLNDAFSDRHSGWHTEDLVKERQITREEQDLWAERSQLRFSAAQAAGKFKNEIVAVERCERNKPGLFDKDERRRGRARVGRCPDASDRNGSVSAAQQDWMA